MAEAKHTSTRIELETWLALRRLQEEDRIKTINSAVNDALKLYITKIEKEKKNENKSKRL